MAIIFHLFHMQRVGNFTCDILKEAIKRYDRVISVQGRIAKKYRTNVMQEADSSLSDLSFRSDPLFEGFLSAVKVHLKQPCEKLPYLNMEESCKHIYLKYFVC